MELHAPAKLNLSLHITGRRDDGYHLLESLVVFTGLQDVLRLEAAETLTLETNGPFAAAAGSDGDNLVLRAARLLKQASGTAQGARLTLEKNIPVGAGLGGGSADAAAALRGLNRLWQLDLNEATLMELAPRLGADVAMCLLGRPLIARGIGDVLDPLVWNMPPLHAVLVHPRIPLLTAQVYAMLDFSSGTKEAGTELKPSGSGLFGLLAHTRNDLQRAAIAASPLVAEVLLAMETALPKPSLVRMTGSGACCFALFEERARSAAFAAGLRAQYPGWWIAETELKSA